uniref:Plastid-encoded RNA polymerase subunit alpha n=1 Tax=Phacus inflexus TaxID=461210 RepID=A0A3G3LKS4_9EUGL|nr:RNA polymerase alpha subunit [Phacus inflexus]AYQ93309.1 RNA polymerase alpha subunit [Phacus inflexus]
MKLIKVIVLKVIKTKNSFYTVFDLSFFRPGLAKSGGNLIRNYLLKNLSSFKVNNVLIFIKNKNNKSSKFFNINQYFPLEEIKDPVGKVVSNLKNLIFYNSAFLKIKKNKNIVASIQASGNNYIIEGKDIKINDPRLKYNINHYVTTILSPSLEMKLIFKIEF